MCLAPVLTSASMENLQWSLRTGERGMKANSIENPEGICSPHYLLAGFCNFSPAFSEAPEKMGKGQEQYRSHTLLLTSWSGTTLYLGHKEAAGQEIHWVHKVADVEKVVNFPLRPASSTLNFSGIFTQCCIFTADINLCGTGIYSRPWLCSYWL